MGELTDKIKGNVNEAIGKVKVAAAGDPTHRSADGDRLAAEGKEQQVEGVGQQFKGKVKGALGDDI